MKTSPNNAINADGRRRRVALHSLVGDGTPYVRAMIRSVASVLLIGVSAGVWPQKAPTTPLPDDEAGRCRYAAEQMIAIGQQSLSEPSSRPERVNKRRKVVEGWAARLEKGEDPCRVYQSIQKAATTF